MNVNARKRVPLFLFLLICFQITYCSGKSLVAPQNSQNKEKTSPGPSTTSPQPQFTCQCDDTPKPLCANNGVTYKNSCKFECARNKTDKLRVVKEGDCGKYISQLQFWSFG